jgi:protein TonB
MESAQARPRFWTPQLVLFSLVLHAVVIYYLAITFDIVPALVTPSDPPVIPTVRYTPPPPPLDDPEPIVRKQPFPVRVPRPAPVQPTVPPLPLPPTVTVPAGPVAIDVRDAIPEQPIAQPLPNYPRSAQERGIQGRVILSITIMPDGSVRDVRVVESNPRGYFEATAVRAVERWRYRPSNVIRTNVIVHMDFELKDA